MFIYEKDKKLNIVFQDTQMPVDEPDVVISKEDDTVSVLVGGKEVLVDEE